MEEIQWIKLLLQSSHKRTHGKVICAEPDCKKELALKTMRPYGGKNYCSKDFKEEIIRDIQHHFSFDSLPTPEVINSLEWGMKVSRILDGGLVKIAETSERYLD